MIEEDSCIKPKVEVENMASSVTQNKSGPPIDQLFSSTCSSRYIHRFIFFWFESVEQVGGSGLLYAV